MVTIKAHFDGRVIVPEQPLDFPIGTELKIHVEKEATLTPPLAALADWAEQLPDNPDSPADGAAQHDHYLYGTPKQP